MTDSMFKTAEGRRLAYNRIAGAEPGVVFLGGFKSDKEGSKALHLEAWARAQGRAFLRFDYSGHGRSSGAFTDGSVGDWTADAAAVVLGLTKGPQVLVGSSMGGWIALLLARHHPESVAGLVTIAAAPDFTEDDMWAGFSRAERESLMTQGWITQPSEYGEPYIITRHLIEDGRKNLVLRSPLRVDAPVRMLQGTADADVKRSVALRLLDHLDGPDIHLEFVQGADHRFSDPRCLAVISRALGEVLAHTEFQ
ncbi:MAG: alpha/beta hydrolase [Rhodobacteraceae bacterium]|nr:alpha/beta hydrolase [Paracoccaceae bacterium]